MTRHQPAELSVNVAHVCELALACWRLQQVLPRLADGHAAAAVRHAARSLHETLDAMAVEIIDFCGLPYDAGLAPEVVDVSRDEGADESRAVVIETVTPTLALRGCVVRPGQIVVRYFSPPLEAVEGTS